MKFRHKLAKFVNGEGIASVARHVRQLRLRRPLEGEVARLKRTIELTRFDEIRREFEVPDPGDTPQKYVQLDHWLRINLVRARELDLDRGKPLRILDLGCGAGYFLYIAQQYGHDVLGLDIDRLRLFAEMTRFLKVPRVIWQIDAFVPLPEFDWKFDLITAHMICFNGHNTRQLWGVPEWQFFLDDVATRLTRGGRLHLSLNHERDGSLYTPALKQFFFERGASIHTERVVFHPLLAASRSAVPA
ncbi:MAG: class I SAM-dependent methyltransferase [Verrucomicrobiota bacterium]|nr:class I SAM-dependent methyltransferase [Verrucomicrobiota bacterium]